MNGGAKGFLAAFAAGALFAIGLALGGMTQPAKVIGFLDFAGAWDPSLIFVMGGAVSVHFVLYRLVRRRASPLFATVFAVPTRRDIDARLVVGAGLFGIGWGLGGFCPGPVLTSIGSGSAGPLVFLLAMTAGMTLQRVTDGMRRSPPHVDGAATARIN